MQTERNPDDIARSLDPENFRKQLVKAAKIFKSNWVEFGEFLTKVASEQLYKAWGYANFEDYCRVEIRIKKHTAIKLTNAYFFVTEGDPDLFKRSGNRGIPDLDTVNILQKAKQDDHCSPEMYEELKQTALDKTPTGQTLARKFRAMTLAEKVAPGQHEKHQSLTIINRLRQTLKRIDDIPSRFETYLSEMEAYFKPTEVKSGEETENKNTANLVAR